MSHPPDAMHRSLSCGGCWCMLPAGHGWPGKDGGSPHPRRAMWSGLARQPWEQGECLNEHCDRLSEPGVWFCCGLCAEASDFRHDAVVHADPCSERQDREGRIADVSAMFGDLKRKTDAYHALVDARKAAEEAFREK